MFFSVLDIERYIPPGSDIYTGIQQVMVKNGLQDVPVWTTECDVEEVTTPHVCVGAGLVDSLAASLPAQKAALAQRQIQPGFARGPLSLYDY